ncbi:MAG: spermidine synthase [Magnetococcales bacterium]|nr:spermidine synthase [Magnetococcales bacterium]
MKLILYSQFHDGHKVEVIEDSESRKLTFDTHLTQSRMYLDDPISLSLGYCRAMMASLLFGDAVMQRNPFRVLMIGLGGGSLVKFLLHHFPFCRMDVVEADKAIPALAREFFYVPDDDPRLTLFFEDGGEFMARVSSERFHPGYDLILLDAFDHEGMVESVYAEKFFAQAQALLTSKGVLTANLIRGDSAVFRHSSEAIHRQFSKEVLGLPVVGTNNEILFVGPGLSVWENRGEIEGRAWELKEKLFMNYPLFVEEMVRVVAPATWNRWLGFKFLR